jgi:hypothetical protein
MKSHPNSDFIISIESSESKVPNYDAEKKERVKLDAGVLAQNRANAMKTALTQLKNKSNVSGDLKFNEPDIIYNVGPEWDGQNAKAQKYKKYQYVDVQIEAINADTSEYAFFGKEGSTLYGDNLQIIARQYFRVSETSDITKQGMTNTGEEDVLIRLTTGNGKFTGENYYIKGKDWNKFVSKGTNRLPEEKLKIIRSGEIGKKVPDSDLVGKGKGFSVDLNSIMD